MKTDLEMRKAARLWPRRLFNCLFFNCLAEAWLFLLCHSFAPAKLFEKMFELRTLIFAAIDVKIAHRLTDVKIASLEIFSLPTRFNRHFPDMCCRHLHFDPAYSMEEERQSISNVPGISGTKRLDLGLFCLSW